MAATPQQIAEYRERIAQTLLELGIPISYAANRRQSFQFEGSDLVSIGFDQAGREQRMERAAALQWQTMREMAGRENIVLNVVSAFRSFDYQRQIITRKLAAGQTIDQILRVSALPGFSEHHTGRAIDINTPGCSPLTEAFEQTAAYAWLARRASEFGFHLSYPRDNPHGVSFEPWHWIFNQRQEAKEFSADDAD